MAYQQRSWAAIDRRRAGYRRAFRKVFQKALDKQIEPILKELQFIDVRNTSFADVEIDNSGIEKAYDRVYRTVAMEFAEFDRKQALKAAGKPTLTKDDDIWRETMMRQIDAYIATGAVGRNIQIVGDTSKEYLQKLLNDLIIEVNEQGLGIGAAQTMLRDKLTSQWHRSMRYRTERIVRTEITAASNWGSLEGIKSTGLPHNKTWLTSPGERTREWHAAADGQTVDINSPFIVDGEPLMEPGDGNASAGNIINCRCSMTFELKSMNI